MMNPRHHLTIADVAFLAEVAGRVTQAELEHGWRQLAKRLAQEERFKSTTSLFAGRTRLHGLACNRFRRELRPNSRARFRAFR
jgi:hypothetical protein